MIISNDMTIYTVPAKKTYIYIHKYITNMYLIYTKVPSCTKLLLALDEKIHVIKIDNAPIMILRLYLILNMSLSVICVYT